MQNYAFTIFFTNMCFYLFWCFCPKSAAFRIKSDLFGSQRIRKYLSKLLVVQYHSFNQIGNYMLKEIFGITEMAQFDNPSNFFLSGLTKIQLHPKWSFRLGAGIISKLELSNISLVFPLQLKPIIKYYLGFL